MELNLPQQWTGQKTQETQCQVHVCGALQSLPPPQGIQSLPLQRAASCTQDDKIFLDLDPEVPPAMAASCNIFNVVVPCSFNGLSSLASL